MASEPGGRADKLGNEFERLWTVRHLIQLLAGRAVSVRIEALGDPVKTPDDRAVSFMAPFGGYKDSGLGRENGIDAVREYLQTKTVWINSGAVAGNPFVMR